MPVTIPVKGSELARAAVASTRKVGEIHTTQPQDRLFIKNVQVGGSKWLGEVADEATMLALNDDHANGCWPGDFCSRTDLGVVYRCILNRGELLAEWFAFPTGSFTGDASDVPFDPTGTSLLATDVEAAIVEVANSGSSALDVWLFS